ncbi:MULTISPECIES: acyl-CoA dehydratase activase-related protein [Clostridium]|uniref:acyl-CoA dehydratase activase-related protein n=1 Tax=Clostridium TaxID=1485 RepID=UPI0008248566|nr:MULTISPECIES: acyl-CoA dehydratase activase-related protein [Clostridium]PJI09625.1 2-hydroxyglutaryl-CoA dehydratase [Clostridium sp. CT7]
MKIGFPKGLLYCDYYPFFNTFFNELGCNVVTSPDTNKNILNLGIKYCVDEACLPIKIFHGHAAYLKDKCDYIFIPRIMSISKGESICPKFCGLPEMIKNSIPDLPKIISYPIYMDTEKNFMKFIRKCGHEFTKSSFKIQKSYIKAKTVQNTFNSKKSSHKLHSTRVALVGHPYNIWDTFSNLNLVNKLDNFNISILTEKDIDENFINNEINNLFKKPFWTFARKSYGFSTFAAKNHLVDGIIYISSFACGIDSVIIDLIKKELKNFPILVLKIDEQTGEAGFNTRLEAFSDMLERRYDFNDNNISSIR